MKIQNLDNQQFLENPYNNWKHVVFFIAKNKKPFMPILHFTMPETTISCLVNGAVEWTGPKPTL
jgi:hypothetical protein